MRKVIQTQKTTLSYSISDAETTMRFDHIYKLDGTSILASDLGDYITFTLDPGTAKEEICSLDSANVVINADNTVDVTNVVRGLKEVDPYAVGGTASDHGVGGIVVFSNNPQLYNSKADLYNDNTFEGLSVFEQAPQSEVDPVAGNDLTRLSYVQTLVLGTLTTINVIVPGKAGTTISAGQLIYFDDPTNRWLLCDADTPATVNNVILGIAQGAGTTGNAIAGGVLLQGVDTHQSGIVEGDTYYASNTAGGISNSAGTTEVTIGIGGQTATQVLFKPRFNQQITENEQDALDGAESPTATNVFITQSRIQKGSENYIADASASSTAYTATFAPALGAVTTGQILRVKMGLANTTTTPTLNPNGLGAATIVKNVSDPLSPGDIAANSFSVFIYNGTQWVLQNPAPAITPFYQRTSFSASANTLCAASTDTTGTVAYAVSQASTTTLNVFRYAFDSVSGMWYQTHTVVITPTSGNITVNTPFGVTVVGSFVYVSYTTNTPLVETKRLVAADLTSETTMTYSGGNPSTSTNYRISYTDGTGLYICSTTVTWKHYTISGTTLTATTDVTSISGASVTGAVWDGSNVIFTDNNPTISKYTAAGASVSSVSRSTNGEGSVRGVGVNSLKPTVVWNFNGIGTTVLAITPTTKP